MSIEQGCRDFWVPCAFILLFRSDFGGVNMIPTRGWTLRINPECPLNKGVGTYGYHALSYCFLGLILGGGHSEMVIPTRGRTLRINPECPLDKGVGTFAYHALSDCN